MQFSNVFDDGDAGYLVDEPSDDEWNPISSDEEEDPFMAYLLKHNSSNRPEIKDDFLTEMNRELDATIDKIHGNAVTSKPTPSDQEKAKNGEGQSSKKDEETEQKYYDDVYFDSDDSDNENSDIKPNTRKEKSKKRHPIPSNDDLFYDPDMDDDDQKWVDNFRRSSQPQTSKTPKIQPLPNSDAVLNCPACMSLLCLDCQRHELYSTQYRAMFVQNCTIDFEQSLKYPLKLKISKKKQKQIKESLEENFHPVKCNICNTEVAVYDKDEIYHFFNVLSSHS